MSFARAPYYLRRVALALLLSLTLAAGVTPSEWARAQAVSSPRPATSAAAAPTAATDVAPIAEAYVILTEHFATPLDPAQLVAASQTAMADALRAKGVDVGPSTASAAGSSQVEQFAMLQDTFHSLAAAHRDVLSVTDLARAAIQGMADSVDDPHTSFFTPDEYQEELRAQRGEAEYAGIGVRLHGPQATVQEVFPNSPAARAGLQPGDTLVAVNGQLTSGLKLDEIVKLVRGPEGAPLVLGVQRASSDRIEAITLNRARIAAPVVTARRLSENVGYVQLRGFTDAVISQVELAIRRQQQDGVQGLVLDLRGNPGGRIVVGEQLLADFVPNGPIYQSVDRQGRRDVHQMRNSHPLLTVPLVVLVDNSTASMGEIFAAAVQERRVGRVVGETTAGAVAASRILPLSDGSALQFSIERIYSGSGALLDRVGVHPDEEVALDLDALRQGRDTQLERAVSDVLAMANAPTAAASSTPIRIDTSTGR